MYFGQLTGDSPPSVCPELFCQICQGTDQTLGRLVPYYRSLLREESLNVPFPSLSGEKALKYEPFSGETTGYQSCEKC